MILGLTGGFVGYIPPREAYSHGGYGVDAYTPIRLKINPIQVPMGFAEKVWETWLEMTYQRWDAVGQKPQSGDR